VPPVPWALSGLLTAAAWGGIAYYAAALSMRKLHKWMIRLPVAMAFLSIAAYVIFLTSVSLSDMNGILTFVFFMMLLPYYALYAVFYIPLAGLVRLVPFLGVSMANTYDFEPMAPMAATVICLMYLSISICFHALGKKLREKAQESAPPDEPPEETEVTPQE
jgi:hypothetical protein